LRVCAVGLCGSDRHWYLEGSIGDATLTRPLVLGHEFSCSIETGRRAGERVAVDPAIPCGRCSSCRAGNRNLCVRTRFAGHGVTDGALRELVAWPAELLCPLPDSLSDAEGALLEPLGVALHALDLAHVRPGGTGAVCGCGPLGLLLVQLLRSLGTATIIATDVVPHRVAAAKSMGATHAIDTRAGSRSELGPAAAETGGVDVAFEVAGDDLAIEDAIALLRPGGRLVLLGIPMHDRSGFTASAARRKGLTIMMCRRMKGTDLPRAAALAERQFVRLGPLVSEQRKLDEAPAAFEFLAARRGLKTVVRP